MLNDNSRRLRARLATSCATAALCAGAANAQPVSDSGIEQVVVSGSRVTIAGYSQPTPVTVVGTAQLQRDAYANIADAVRNLPQVNSPPTSYGTTQSNASGGQVGTNLINLRTLGFARTLVLFDGQRSVASNIAGGVDVTTLPSAIVSRVDVVTGGASAAWGSDAVAGVVNFVINKNYTGFKASIQAGANKSGTARSISVEGAWGGDLFGGRGHFEVAGNINIKPDVMIMTDANWFKGAYFVSNPAYAPGNGQPQLIVAFNVGQANATMGGIINSSPAGVAGPGVTPAPANALRGIQFVENGIPQVVNYGNLTLNAISNGGSFSARDGQQSWSTIANPTSTYTLFGYGRYKLTDTIQASVQLNYGYFTGKGSAPGTTQTSLVIKSDNAFIPSSVRATMQAGGITSFTMGTLNGNNFDTHTVTAKDFYRQAQGAMAPAIFYARRNLARGVASLDGTLGSDWSWNAYAQYSAVRFSAHVIIPIVANLTAAQDAVTVTTANRGTSGLPLGSIVCRSSLPGQSAVVVGSVTAQTGCIPLNVFGEGVASPAALAYITGLTSNSVDFAHQTNSQVVSEGSMQGTLPWELPAGKVAVAFGMGYRKEAGRAQTTDIAVNAGYAQSNFPRFPSASYNVIEGFAEIDAPIIKDGIVNTLDISMAGRMTSYSTSGLVETWKLGLTSQVNDDIKLRTTWSVDIRAPQLVDLFSPGTTGVGTQRDPKTQLTVPVINRTTGNPNLHPEIARTISGGVVLTPTFIPGFSMSADWYSINLTGAIAQIPITTILAACNSTLPSPVNPGQNGNPNDPLCAGHLVFNGPGGALSNTFNSNLNISSQTTSGLDIQVNYIMDFWEGSLAWAATANLNDENTTNIPGAGKNDFAGSNGLQGNTGAGPKWRGVLSAEYSTGPYTVAAQARWFGSSITYQNGNSGNLATAATANLYEEKYFHLPITAYLDLRGNYKWNDNITIYGAVDNALNIPPPLLPPLASDTQFGIIQYFNVNPVVYDIIGRAFRVGVRFSY